MSLVTFSNVSKQFSLGRERAGSFQELWLSVVRPKQQRLARIFAALDGVSFSIGAGETVGFIGANGAGKSSILKLIARILEPTSGSVTVNGRVSALLELGSGFHPDLTGRENIFLNGSIMGLSRRHIERHVDAIISFAGLERFIDVPVKYYSSGMYVRLGFSVAIHTDPEILLVDEVLAVGDQDFQHKCLRQIQELRRSGVTIILVSHSLDQIETQCDRAIWIQDGHIVADGQSVAVVDQYRSLTNRRLYAQDVEELSAEPEDSNRWGTREAELTRVELLDAGHSVATEFRSGDSLCLRLHYSAPERVDNPTFGLAFYRSDGLHINGPNSVREGVDIPFIEGEGHVDYVVDALPLNQGEYEVTAAIYNRNSTVALDHHHRQYRFRVVSASYWREEGVVHMPAQWRHHP
jgi:lipopolysaccharide transport system ATP-binding protein